MLWSGLQQHRSWHSNEMTLLPILLAAVYLGTGNCSSKIVDGSFLLQLRPRCLRNLSEICKSVIKIFWNLLLETVKYWQYCCLAVICRKWSAFDMQFHLRVVSILLKTCVKDHVDGSSRLLERRVWLLCIEALWFVVLWTFWSSLSNWPIIFKPLDWFFNKIKILEINLPFIWPFGGEGVSFKIIDIL